MRATTGRRSARSRQGGRFASGEPDQRRGAERWRVVATALGEVGPFTPGDGADEHLAGARWAAAVRPAAIVRTAGDGVTCTITDGNDIGGDGLSPVGGDRVGRMDVARRAGPGSWDMALFEDDEVKKPEGA